MNRKRIVIRNSSIGLLSQFFTVAFAFITRSVFIKYVGLELLGINNTFSSVLNTLSLTELGFETAVVYSLYQPVYDKDENKINDIINILKLFYRCIGIVICVGAILILPFLRYILTGVSLSESTVYLYFLLQASSTIASYFLIYKRTLLYAEQMEYIYKIIDMISNCLLNIAQCVMLICFQSYIIYLILKVVQVIVSNVIVHVYCSRKFPFLHKKTINKEILRGIIQHVKNIFVGKFAGFIYSSTDSLVISAFINTVSVAYYGNYTIIVSNLKNLTTSLLAPVAPVVGNFFVEEKKNEDREKVFLLYTHLRVWIALIVVLPLVVLLNDFIAHIWLSSECMLPLSVTYLLAADFYIHLVHSSSVDYINGMGLFRMEKYIELLGAISNIIFSVILVKKWEISGVIAGTVLSQGLFWIGRSAVVYYRGMHLSSLSFFKYWIKNIYYIIIFLLCSFGCTHLYKYIQCNSYIVKFIIGGICCEICALTVGMIGFSKMYEQKRINEMIKSIIKKRI